MNEQPFGPTVAPRPVEEPSVEPKKKSEGNLWKILAGLFGVIALVLGVLLLLKKEPMTVVFVNEDNIRLEKVSKGDKVKKPTMEDEDFLGWFDGETEFDFTKGVDKDYVLYAKFDTSKQFTVTFDTDGGSTIEPVKVKENKTLTRPASPTKAGLIFNEWTLNGEVFDFSTPITSDITLKATWRENDNTVMVRFDSAGGSNVASQKVAVGGVAKKPNNPTKSCATFEGWTLNGEAYDFSKAVNSEITLKATWKDKQKVTLTYDANGGSVSPTSKQVCPGEAVGALATPTKSGYVFTRWTLSGNTFNANSKVNGNTTIKAEFKTQDQYDLERTLANVKASYDITKNGQTISVQAYGSCKVTHSEIKTSSTSITFTVTCGSETGTKTAKAVYKQPTYSCTFARPDDVLPYTTFTISGVTSGKLYSSSGEWLDNINNGQASPTNLTIGLTKNSTSVKLQMKIDGDDTAYQLNCTVKG